MTILGLITGALVGVCAAPSLVSLLAGFGVDQVSFLPAAPIVLCSALLGAYAARRPGAMFLRVARLLFL